MPVRPAPEWRTGLQEVAPNTYAYLQHDGGWGISNAGFMVGDDGLMIIDATMVAAMAQNFITEIRRVSDLPYRHLINTHSHLDHTGGNRLFTGAEIISHSNCLEEMQAQAARPPGGPRMGGVAALMPESEGRTRMFEMVDEDPDRYIKMPTVTYEDRMTLHYGDTEVQLLYYGPAHTYGDTLVYFPESKTLFAGDIAFFYAMPFAAAGKVGGWLQVIDRVKELDVDLIVPGHGPVGGKQELEDEREYFAFVMEQAERCFGEGMPVERAAQEIDLGAYADWPESERFITNLAVAYEELRGDR